MTEFIALLRTAVGETDYELMVVVYGTQASRYVREPAKFRMGTTVKLQVACQWVRGCSDLPAVMTSFTTNFHFILQIIICTIVAFRAASVSALSLLW